MPTRVEYMLQEEVAEYRKKYYHLLRTLEKVGHLIRSPGEPLLDDLRLDEARYVIRDALDSGGSP